MRRFAIPTLCLAGLWIIAWYALPFAFSLPEGLRTDPTTSPVLTDRSGTPIHHLVLPDSTRRAPVSLDQIPGDLIACTLAAEDKRFFSHGGVDRLATSRAGREFARERKTPVNLIPDTANLRRLTFPELPAWEISRRS